MKAMLLRSLVCCFLAGFAVLAFGATAPPPLPFEDLEWSAQVHRKPATGLTMGRLTALFEKTPLSHVLQEAGGVIAESGDAADTLWLCYTIVDTKHSERIWLTSNGEMDGPAHAISGVIAQTVADGPTADCPALPATFQPVVSVSNGVWLGTAESRLIGSFGVKPGIKGSWHGYVYSGKRRGRCKPDDSDVVNSIEWTATDGLVDSIMAGQTTSC
jgi:hypothetical protein